MAADIQLTVTRREGLGKSKVTPLRNKGMVPGIYYDAEGANIPVQVEENPLAKAYRTVGKSHVLTLKIDGSDEVVEKQVFIWQLDRHPYKNRILHVDFFSPDMTKPVVVSVPLKIVGKAAGAAEGGRVQVLRDRVNIETLPTTVPDAIEVNVTPMKIGNSFLISQCQTPEGVKMVFKQDFALVTVLPPKGAKKGRGEEGEED